MMDSETSLVMLMLLCCFISITSPGSGGEREVTHSNQETAVKD